MAIDLITLENNFEARSSALRRNDALIQRIIAAMYPAGMLNEHELSEKSMPYIKSYNQYFAEHRVIKIKQVDATESLLQKVKTYLPTLTAGLTAANVNIRDLPQEEKEDLSIYIKTNDHARSLLKYLSTTLFKRTEFRHDICLQIIAANMNLSQGLLLELGDDTNAYALQAQIYNINSLLTETMHMIIQARTQKPEASGAVLEQYTNAIKEIFNQKRKLYAQLHVRSGHEIPVQVTRSFNILENYFTDRYLDSRGESFGPLTYTRTQKLNTVMSCSDDIVMQGILTNKTLTNGAAKDKRLGEKVKAIHSALGQTPALINTTATKKPIRHITDTRERKVAMFDDGTNSTISADYHKRISTKGPIEAYFRNLLSY